jgi:Type II secretion system (T2SS), protein M subtype b
MDTGRLTPILKSLKRRLRDPLQLRLFLGCGMLGSWCLVVYSPLSDGIEEAKRERTLAVAHLTMARDIEALRVQDAKYKPRLPTGTDPNEWVEYLLGGVRKSPIRLLKLEPQSLRKHGPYDVVVVRIEAQGSFADLTALLAWIETNPRLLRVDSLILQPTRGVGRDLVLNLTVLGVMG